MRSYLSIKDVQLSIRDPDSIPDTSTNVWLSESSSAKWELFTHRILNSTPALPFWNSKETTQDYHCVVMNTVFGKLLVEANLNLCCSVLVRFKCFSLPWVWGRATGPYNEACHLLAFSSSIFICFSAVFFCPGNYPYNSSVKSHWIRKLQILMIQNVKWKCKVRKFIRLARCGGSSL